MALPTVTVTGTVNNPKGVGVTGGRIITRLLEPGSVLDGAVNMRVGGAAPRDISDAGVVNFEIVPNDQITPSGGIYEAIHYPGGPDQIPWRELWGPILSAPDPIDIGDIPRPAVNPVNLHALAEHVDTKAGVPADGQGYFWSASEGLFTLQAGGGGGSTTLEALSDTNVGGKIDQDLLAWDSASGKWVPVSNPKPSVYTTPLDRPALIPANDYIFFVFHEAGKPAKLQMILPTSVGTRTYVTIAAGDF